MTTGSIDVAHSYPGGARIVAKGIGGTARSATSGGLSDAVGELTAAARLVMARWEVGDLAEAVTELGRALAWVDDETASRLDGDEDVLLLCDGCYQSATGLAAECEDGCPQVLDHAGLCLRRSEQDCGWCGGCGRLHEVSRTEVYARLPTVGEENEGQWFLHWPGDRRGPYPSARTAWDAWHAAGDPGRVDIQPGHACRQAGVKTSRSA